MTHNKLITARKQISEQQKLLDTPKKRKRGKRVALKGKFVFTTEEVLEIAQTAEAETAARSASNSLDEEIVLENNSCDSELSCIVVCVEKLIDICGRVVVD